MHKRLTLFVGIVAALSSCSKDIPTSSTPSEFIHAKAGSTFTFDEYSTDSTNAINDGSRDTMISTILRTDGAIGGKSGVLLVEENRAGARDTVYYAYETNENLSYSYPSYPTWETIPTGTGLRILRSTDYSLFSGPDTTAIHDSTITTLASTENIIIKGQTVSVKKMELSYRHRETYNGVNGIESKREIFLYYAPSLGLIVKKTSQSFKDPYGRGWVDGSYQMLIDYNLK